MISLILGLFLGGVAVMFALQNVFPVTVAFLSWDVTMSLALVVALSVLAGLIIGALVSIPGMISSAMTISGLKKENRKLHEDIDAAYRDRQRTVIIKEPDAPRVL